MNMLVYLIPAALFLGALGLAAFLWSIRNGQYEDLDGAAYRILEDGDEPLEEGPVRHTARRSGDDRPPGAPLRH